MTRNNTCETRERDGATRWTIDRQRPHWA